MFTSCCRCVNKKASLNDDQSSENESDDSKSEKHPSSDNNLLIQKIPLKDPSIVNNGKEYCDTSTENVSNTPDSGILTTATSVVDTVITEEEEEGEENEIQALQEIDKDKKLSPLESTEVNENETTLSERHEHIVSHSSNISDEEKQKILDQFQHQNSTDNEDEGEYISFILNFR